MHRPQIASDESRERVEGSRLAPGEPAGGTRALDRGGAADLQRQRAMARAILRQAGVRVRRSEA